MSETRLVAKHDKSPTKRPRRAIAATVAAGLAIILAGCTPTELAGFLPGWDETGVPATSQTAGITAMWVNSWIVLLGVGVLTWGLIGWALIVYRRRKGQTGLPVQLRYNMPIEIFFTVVPLIFIIGMFAFTAQEQALIEERNDDPDVVITAYAKQWAWDFVYHGDEADGSDDVYSVSIQAQPDVNGTIDRDQAPTLYLPVDKELRIELRSRDVVHSFWIVEFLYKKDMYIGRDNSWSFTPTRVGDYKGVCAELCGEYHSMMLFNVKVVEQDEYDAYLETLREEGNVGNFDEAYDRLQNYPGTGPAEGEH